MTYWWKNVCVSRYVCKEGSSISCPSDDIHGYRCPAGFYCPTGSSLEIPCDPGTFSPMPAASTCLPCPAGSSCMHMSTVEPLNCPQGNKTGMTICQGIIPEYIVYSYHVISIWVIKSLYLFSGNYCPAMTATPIPCPTGTLNPIEGALSLTSCKRCPAGRYCRGEANWKPDGKTLSPITWMFEPWEA